MAKCGRKFLWLFILLALCAVLLTVLLSGDILLYLAPRMVPMVWFGFAYWRLYAYIRVLKSYGVFGGVPGETCRGWAWCCSAFPS